MLMIDENKTRKRKISVYQTEYARTHYKRFSVFMMPDDAERVKRAAKEKGMSINGFICEAVLYYMIHERV